MILPQTRKSHCCTTVLALLLLAWTGLTPLTYGQQKSSGSATNTTASHPHSLVNVNTADAKTLETLPGVGPTTAQRIIDGRPYHKLADLEKVKGLSQTKVEALKGKVSFGEPRAINDKTIDSTKTTHDGSSSDSASKHTAQASKGSAPTSSTAGADSSSSHSAAPKLAPGEKININKASVEELDRLPGIGKTKAQAIVDYRNQNGSFKTLEELEKVKGIKAGSFEKVKDHIKLSD